MTTKRERPTGHSDRTAELLSAQDVAVSSRGDDFRPSSAATSKLDWEYKNPDFEYYWFSNAENSNDTPHRGLSLGFTFEQWPLGPQKGEVVEIKSGATTMTLMKITKRLYAMIMEDRAKAVDRTDMGLNAMASGEYGAIDNDSKVEGQGAAVRQDIEKSSSLNNPLMPRR